MFQQDETHQQTASQWLHDPKETFLYLLLKAESPCAEPTSQNRLFAGGWETRLVNPILSGRGPPL